MQEYKYYTEHWAKSHQYNFNNKAEISCKLSEIIDNNICSYVIIVNISSFTVCSVWCCRPIV